MTATPRPTSRTLALIATMSLLPALSGCSSAVRNQPGAEQPLANVNSDADKAPAPAPAAPNTYTAADACTQMLALDNWQACSILSDDATFDRCVETMDDLVTRTPRARRHVYADLYQCVVKNGSTCAGQQACSEQWSSARYRGCDRDEDNFGPVQPAPDAVTPSGRLAELDSSLGDPVEVCGVRGEVEFLMLAQCANGSNPYANSDQIRDSRAGSFGTGGRCDSIIDMYKVPCPEKTYQVYMDMYVCHEGESML